MNQSRPNDRDQRPDDTQPANSGAEKSKRDIAQMVVDSIIQPGDFNDLLQGQKIDPSAENLEWLRQLEFSELPKQPGTVDKISSIYVPNTFETDVLLGHSTGTSSDNGEIGQGGYVNEFDSGIGDQLHRDIVDDPNYFAYGIHDPSAKDELVAFFTIHAPHNARPGNWSLDDSTLPDSKELERRPSKYESRIMKHLDDMTNWASETIETNIHDIRRYHTMIMVDTVGVAKGAIGKKVGTAISFKVAKAMTQCTSNEERRGTMPPEHQLLQEGEKMLVVSFRYKHLVPCDEEGTVTEDSQQIELACNSENTASGKLFTGFQLIGTRTDPKDQIVKRTVDGKTYYWRVEWQYETMPLEDWLRTRHEKLLAAFEKTDGNGGSEKK